MRCDISVIDEWYCCFIRFMLSEDLGNVNPKHEIMRICVECDY